MQVDGKTTVEKRIAGAFKAAGEATGTSFRYLLSTSARESSHRADLAAETSSAKGLFQFVDQTWFDLIRREGPSVGLERLAEKITPDGKGGWTVADARDRARILSLKTDPLVASVMAGKLTAENTSRLTDTLGRGPTDGELYAAHVLGAAGATKLIRSASSEPNTAAAVVFPRAAAANAALFYDRGGRARTVAELHATLTRSPDPAADPTSTRIAEAHAALAAQPRTDPATVALLLRAQAAATVAAEPVGTATAAAAAKTATPGAAPATTTPAPTAAERTLLRTAVTATAALPGAGEGTGVGRPGGVDGWRARAGRDAFAGMMRSDAAALEATAVLDAARTGPALARPPAPPVALAAAGGRRVAGGASGGIPLVDPDAPMSLAAQPTQPAGAAAVDRLVGPALRPSRLVAPPGAYDRPLPMVDAASGATRPSRMLFDRFAAPSAEAVAAGAVRVRTTAITMPPAASGAAAVDVPAPSVPIAAAPRRAAPLLPPVPGEEAAAPAVTVLQGAPRSARSSRRPMDLTAGTRGGPVR